MRVKNWNRMQNAAALWGILSTWGICMIATWNFTTCVFLSHVRNIGMKSVTYWYQFFTRCEELVPILHGVKFTKCEIYGLPWKNHRQSTKCLESLDWVQNICLSNDLLPHPTPPPPPAPPPPPLPTPLFLYAVSYRNRSLKANQV